MFVETKKNGEIAQQVGKLKLSEAIRIGVRENREYRSSWFDNTGGYCAICCGIKGLGGEPEKIYDRGFEGLYEWLSDRVSAPRETIRSASTMHHDGMPATEVADWLEAQGF